MSIVDIIDYAAIPYNQNNSMVSCQKGPTRHAQMLAHGRKGPFGRIPLNWEIYKEKTKIVINNNNSILFWIADSRLKIEK